MNDQTAQPPELIGSFVQRPLARRITPLAIRLGLSPGAITLLSLALALAAAWLFAVASSWWEMAGAGVLVFVASVLDCVDGAVARATGTASPGGAWLDTMVDKTADAALAVGITYAQVREVGEDWVWILGAASAAAWLIGSYSKKEYAIRFGEPVTSTTVIRLANRDVRTFGIFAGAIVGQVYWAMVVLALLSISSSFRIAMDVRARSRA